MARKKLTIADVPDVIDTVTMDVPLLIRVMEMTREDIKSDVELHEVVTNILKASKAKDVLTIEDYDSFAPVTSPALARLKEVAEEDYLEYYENTQSILERLGGTSDKPPFRDYTFQKSQARRVSTGLTAEGFNARGGGLMVHKSWPISVKLVLGGGVLNARIINGRY